jgi:hypothetical protein
MNARQALAWTLRQEGLSWRAIGDQLGMTRSNARQLFLREENAIWVGRHPGIVARLDARAVAVFQKFGLKPHDSVEKVLNADAYLGKARRGWTSPGPRRAAQKLGLRNMKGYGVCGFVNTVRGLLAEGIAPERILSSSFWQRAPLAWHNAARRRKLI